MSRCLFVTAHGFRNDGPSIPTHVRVDAFRAWAEECRKRLGGFGDASDFVRRMTEPETAAESGWQGIHRPVLTFDDALGSIETVAETLAQPAMLFVVVDHVGRFNDWPGQPSWVPRERCLSWASIRHLADRGWRIGAHTMNHPCLSRCKSSEIRSQIERSKQTIEDRLGQPCDLFAYPYGDAPAEAREIVRELGLIGFGTSPGVVDRRAELACLPRVDLFDLVRPGIASAWAWSHPRFSGRMALRIKRSLGRFVPRRSAA